MAVSSLEIVKLCGYSPVSSISRHKSTVKLESRKRVFRLADSRRLGRCVRIYSSSPRNGGDNQSKGQLFSSSVDNIPTRTITRVDFGSVIDVESSRL